MLAVTYQSNFWSSATYFSEEDSIHVRIHIPKYISDYVSREIQLEVSNKSGIAQTLSIVVEGKMDDGGTEKCLLSSNLNSPFIYITASLLDKDNTTGSSAIELEVPPFGGSVSSLWIVVKPVKRIQDGQCVALQFYMDESPMVFEDNPDGKFIIQFDRYQTLIHSAIGNLLLPPWSNAVLPSVVFFAVWFVEKSIKTFSSSMSDNENKK